MCAYPRTRTRPEKWNVSMLRPTEAARRLAVHPATLRRWSGWFSAYLSPSATTLPRSYTDDDIAVLTTIQEALNARLSVAEIHARFPVPGVVVRDDTAQQERAITQQERGVALVADPEVVAILTEIAAGQRELLAELRAMRVAPVRRGWLDWLRGIRSP